jgi:hypothetical protein
MSPRRVGGVSRQFCRAFSTGVLWSASARFIEIRRPRSSVARMGSSGEMWKVMSRGMG